MSGKGKVVCLGLVLVTATIVWGVLGWGKREKQIPGKASQSIAAKNVSQESGSTLSPSSCRPDSVSSLSPTSQTISVLATWRNMCEPVEGVSVTLSPLMASREEKALFQPVSGWTDKAGRLALTFPPDISLPRNLRCLVKADGPGVAPLVIERARVYTTDTLELLLDKAYDFHGTVYWDPKGTGNIPAPGAQVSVVGTPFNLFSASRSEEQVLAQVTTDAQGRYEIHSFPDSPVYVRARLGEFVFTEPSLPVMPEHGKESGPFNFYLERGVTLTALVSDKATLQPIPNAAVEVELAAGGFSLSATTNGEGFCSLDGLPSGSFRSFAQADGYAQENTSIEMVRDGDNTVSFYLDKGGQARIRTVDLETKAPVGNVDFKVWVPYKKSAILAHSDARGLALVDGIPVGPQVHVDLIGRSEFEPKIYVGGNTTQAESSFEVEAGKTVEVELRLREKSPRKNRHDTHDSEYHPIKGTVVDEAGRPVPGVLITASSYCCYAQTVTDTEGHFLIEKACIAVFPSETSPLPDIKTLIEQHPNYECGIMESEREYCVAREGYVAEDGSVQPYYVGPVSLKLEADGYCPAYASTGIDRETRIVLQDKNKGALSGRIIDKETKEPITDYTIHGHDSPFYIPNDIGKKVYSENGLFSLTGLFADDSYFLFVESEGYMQRRVEAKVGTSDIEIQLERQRSLRGVIVEEKTQEPVPGVEIRFLVTERSEDRIRESADIVNHDYVVAQFTDTQGAFSLKQSHENGCLLLLSEDYECRMIPLSEIEWYRSSDSGKIIIPLDKNTGSLTVRFVPGMENFVGNNPLRLTYWEEKYQKPLPEPIVTNNAYRWENLRNGFYYFDVHRTDSRETRSFFYRIGLSRGENKTLLIGDECRAHLSGRILNASGEPAPNATIILQVHLDEGMEWIQHSYGSTADANGYYRFDNILPGTYSHFVSSALSVEDTLKIFRTNNTSLVRDSLSVSGNIQHDFTIPRQKVPAN